MATRNSNSLSGIKGFFEDLEAGETPLSTQSVERSANSRKVTAAKQKTQSKSSGTKRGAGDTKSETPSHKRSGRTNPPSPAAGQFRHPLPTGRPPGKKDGEGPRRAKASLWIDAELLDAYRERVYDERRHLSEIVEDALRAHRNANWQ